MRTLNRPSSNITAPTVAHPAAAYLGVKAARSVTRHARTLAGMLAGPIDAQRVDVRDRYILAAAGITCQDGPNLHLTDDGRALAVQL